MDIAQLAERIGVRHGVEHDQARDLVDDIFRAVAVAAYTDGELTLPGLGRVVVSNDLPALAEPSSTMLDDLERASDELLVVASRAADAAQRRGDEIDRDLARIRQIIAGAA